MADSATIEREKHTKQLKRKIECWRELILSLNSILLWEQSWYPALILGITTTIFLLIWTLEPTVLTIISVSLLVLALIDYIVPPITSFLSPANNWTGQKEKELDEICQNLSALILQLQSLWKLMLQTRKDRPNFYCAGIIICLMLCIWIGNTVNNLLLFYIAVNAILLMPGLRHKKRPMAVINYVRDFVKQS
ncbi:ADP-ribosylation factor-like protein 6-interacting protein 1 [Ceratina calcarata]|uniref:ADP-ribosylation factor-like protein 6-interacting protein 1 n=1 Tax=Ceratina calcarata TaxID=156304 RepID=A0AAJ7JEH9_9HYME|nr:ADP-ribosylation factor-like protein 6-interacting protein 1 [Ceratina calcarata]